MSTDLDPLVRRYQNSVQDPSTPALDQLILAAADKRAVLQRRIRRYGVFALAAAVLSITTIRWQIYGSGPIPAAVNPGKLEGATRDYLLHVEAHSYSGPGLYENQP